LKQGEEDEEICMVINFGSRTIHDLECLRCACDRRAHEEISRGGYYAERY
jgi:hypothetical protein